nr:uncharacterized protein LOC109733133 [Aegilops tauschii subsp. strangulata]
METLAQRVAKRAKMSMGGKPPASTSRTPELVVISPDNSPRRSPRFSPQHLPSTNPKDVDTVIKEVAKDAKAEADKIAAEEAAKTAVEEAARGPAGEASKDTAEGASEAAAGEADKAVAEEEEANDQPSSPPAPASGRYLKVGDDLFVHLPGTAGTRAPAEGEVFDDEALAAVGLQVVDEPSPGDGGSREEKLLQATSTNFQKLQVLHRLDKVKSRMVAVDKAEADLEERVTQTQAWFVGDRDKLKAVQDELAEHRRELVLKQPDVKKAQEAAKEQAAKDEAARQQHQALLNS